MRRDLIIDNWQKGIGASPYVGFSSVINCDIHSTPGALKVNRATSKKSSTTVTDRPNWFVRDPLTVGNIFALDASGNVYYSSNSGTSWANISNIIFTCDHTTDTLTSTSHGLVENDTVIFTGSDLPDPIVAGTTYHIIAGGLTANNFKISETQGGGALAITDNGSGTMTFKGAASTHGNGLAIFEDHLIVARDAVLDTYGPLSTTPVWNYNWQTIDSDNLWHPMMNSRGDGKLYGGASNYVFSIEETAGDIFEPLVSASYTFTQQALDLPSGYRIKCLAELGDNLMLGTWKGTNTFDFRIATIFPWDTTSPSFGLPIELDECGVNAMINIQNTLYVFAGITGSIYASNGYAIAKFAQIPESMAPVTTPSSTGTAGGAFDFYPGGVMAYRNCLYFGIGNGVPTIGVYSIDLSTRAMCVEHTISTGSTGTAGNEMAISALLSIGYVNFLIGWKDNTTYGIDSESDKYSSYKAIIETPLYRIKDYNDKKSFTEFEWFLGKELGTGEGIQIKYRVNLTDSWSSITKIDGSTLTMDYSNLGAITSYWREVKLPETSTIQFQIALTTPGDSDATPELLSVIFR